MSSNHLILCCSLFLLPWIFPSIRIFSNELALHFRWPRYWNFTFRISSSNEYSGLISFKIDWFDLLAVQGTLKSLLQHHISKARCFWANSKRCWRTGKPGTLQSMGLQRGGHHWATTISSPKNKGVIQVWNLCPQSAPGNWSYTFCGTKDTASWTI